MNKYLVTLELACTYEVDAPNEETAIDIAYDWFNEAIPNIMVENITTKEIEEDE